MAEDEGLWRKYEKFITKLSDSNDDDPLWDRLLGYSAAAGAVILGLVGLGHGYQWWGIGGSIVVAALGAGIGAIIGAILFNLIRAALWLGAIGLPIAIFVAFLVLTWGLRF